MAAMVARRISQETFDATVAENMEEFEMEREEAIADAISQFKTQGIDLSNVDTTGREDRREEQERLLQAFGTLEREANAAAGRPAAADASELTSEARRTELLGALATMGEACATDRSRKVTVYRALIVARHAVRFVAAIILGACDADEFDAELVSAALNALLASVSGHVETRDTFKQEGGIMAVGALLRRYNHESADAAERTVVQRALLLLGAACKGTEVNKAAFMTETPAGTRVKGGEVLVGILRAALTPAAPSGERDQATAFALCVALRSIATADDLRKDFSSAYDSSRALVDAGAIDVILDAATAFNDDLATLGAILEAAKTVAKNEDAVKQIAKRGGITMCATVLRSHPDDTAACRHAASLLRNMSASDDSKDVMCSDGTLELMLAAKKRHGDDAALQEHTCATVANMALRRPANAVKIVALGGANLVIAAMRTHAETHAVLQRQGCLAIRNIVARSPELREPILDAGAEGVLRAASKLSQTNVDMAYAGLRDLGIDVQVVKFTPPTAKGEDSEVAMEAGVEQFGAKKAQFRPVFEESDALEETIADAAHAPSEDMRF